MSFGPKYRIPSRHSIDSILNQFKTDLDLFIYKFAIDYNKPLEYFNMQKINIVYKFMQYIHHNFKYTLNPNIKNKNLKNSIKNLNENFITTYVDKAANKHAIILKLRYYF